MDDSPSKVLRCD